MPWPRPDTWKELASEYGIQEKDVMSKIKKEYTEYTHNTLIKIVCDKLDTYYNDKIKVVEIVMLR